MEPQDPSLSKVQLWQSEIDHLTTECLTHFSGLSLKQLNWAPDERTWSIAQNLTHVIRLNESYFTIFNQLKAKNYTPSFWVKIPFLPKFMGKILLKSVQPTSKKKVKTAPLWEPDRTTASLKILTTFQQHQKELKTHIHQMAALLPKGIVLSSPAHRHIVYPLETAICLLIAHEKRHLKKAKELTSQFPSGLH